MEVAVDESSSCEVLESILKINPTGSSLSDIVKEMLAKMKIVETPHN